MYVFYGCLVVAQHEKMVVIAVQKILNGHTAARRLKICLKKDLDAQYFNYIAYTWHLQCVASPQQWKQQVLYLKGGFLAEEMGFQ